MGAGVVNLQVGMDKSLIAIDKTGNVNIVELNVIQKPLGGNISFEEIKIDFDPNIHEYSLRVPFNVRKLTPIINVPTGVSYNASNNEKLIIGENKVIVEIKNNNQTDIYTFNVTRENFYIQVTNFAYANKVQTYIVPSTGKYKIELWGGSGNGAAYGAYTSGDIYLMKDEILYVYVGNKYIGSGSGFNAGTGSSGGQVGGGATDVRLVGGTWSDFASLKSRIMVAASGGSGSPAGAAGGLTGYNGGGTKGGTQTSVSAKQSSSYTDSYFGIANGGCSGGNGYYPAGGAACASGAGGGSSFISGHKGSNAITETSTSSKIVHTGQSIHYSGKSFDNTIMIDGKGYKWTDVIGELTLMPNPSGGTFASGKGNNGTGYARITPLPDIEFTNNANLESLSVSSGTLEPAFDKDTHDYVLEISEDTTNLEILGIPEDINAKVLGNGEYKIAPGTKTISLNVTASDGTTVIYNIEVTRIASTNPYLKGIKLNGVLFQEFQEDKFEYNIELPYNYDVVYVEGILANEYQRVSGNGLKVLENNEAEANILVVSEDGNHNQLYTLHFTLEKSTLLKNVKFKELNKTLVFEPNKFDYEIEIHPRYHSLDLEVSSYYQGVNLTITGNKYLGEKSRLITIKSELEGVLPTTYNIKINFMEFDLDEQVGPFNFPYTGLPQTFVAPISTFYNIELWGGAGEGNNAFGGYTNGKIYLDAGETLYVYVGSKSKVSSFNAGAGSSGGWTGGGATDVRLVGGTWSDFNSIKSRIMVAGAGGSGSRPGSGGGLAGYNGGGTKGGTQTSASAKQTSGYTNSYFGIANGGCSGGNGYYPAGGAACASGAGGGSSFISGHNGSNAISASSTSNKVIHTGSSNHYSGKVFTDTIMIDGNGYLWTDEKQGLELMPNPNGGYFASGKGNNGNGYARISTSSFVNNDNYLDNIILTDKDSNNIDIDFESWTLEYNIALTENQNRINIDAITKDADATITGTGDFDIPPYESSREITVTAKDGTIRIYTLNFNRAASSDPNPIDIKLNRLPLYMCKKNIRYCNYTFDATQPNYNIELPYSLTEVEIMPVLKSNYQKYNFKTLDKDGNEVLVSSYNGVFNLTNEVTTIIVEIISEDEKRSSEYTYTFSRDLTGNNNLSSLKVKNPDIDIPDFEPNKYEYYLTIPKGYDSYEVEALPEASKARVRITGNTNLKVGMNDCIITVTAENGETKTYIIHMYKEYEANVFLSDLKVTANSSNLELTPIFDKRLNDYSINVGPDINSIVITATKEDSSAVVIGAGPKTLKSGINIFPIEVKSSIGDITNTYTITIYKDMDNNAFIKNIEVNGYELDPIFDKNTDEYYIYLNNGETALDIDVTMESELATYTIRGNTSLNKAVNEIVITGIAENKDYKVYKIYAIKNVSDNNYLSSLTPSEGVLNPTFDKEHLDYSIDVSGNTDKITINATTEDRNATIYGTGVHYLKVGANTINIVVTSESGQTRTYNLTINREQNNDTSLKEVKNNQDSNVGTGSSTEYDYIINVQYEVSAIEITGIPNANTSKVTGNGTYKLNTGNNDITLTVTAEDGSTKSYIVRVVRDLSNNDDLFFLYVHEGGLNPNFSETTIIYDIKVPYDTDTLHIEALTEDKNAKYEVVDGQKSDNIYTYDISDLNVGASKEIIVKVTAENGIDTKLYTINVTKQASTTENLSLESLDIKYKDKTYDLTPIFNPNTLNYELVVPNDVSEIEVIAKALSDTVKIEGTGTRSLKVGKNGITVFVIGIDGVEKDYQIVITRKKSSDATLANLVVKGYSLNPKFNSATLEYNLITSGTALEFTTIKPTETEATYEIGLLDGDSFTVLSQTTLNTIDISNFNATEELIIRVTAPDGESTKDYKLILTKEPSKNNNLASLEVMDYVLTPVFHKGVTFYIIDVPNNVNSVLIKGTAEDSTATIDGLGVKTIETGENYFDIVVTSKAGTKKTYTILVTKDTSDNNYLANLASSDGTWNKDFDKLVNDYEIVVSNDIDVIEFFGKAEDYNAIVQGLTKHSLVLGNNKFEITVTSESGLVNVYTINVIRESVKSAYLSNLEVKDYELDPEFNKEIFEYYITVNNEVTFLDLNYTKEDENAVVTITGNENFIVGMNEVYINVTREVSEDIILEKEYILYVNRQLSTNNYLSSLYLSNGTLTPDFDKETTSYKVSVSSNIEEVTIYAVTEDISAKIIEGTGVKKLNPGINKVSVKVRSAIGVTRTYILEITREESNNNKLIDLLVKNLLGDVINPTTAFNPDINTYTYNLDTALEYINITYHKGEEYQNVIGTGVKELKPGVNKFDVIVTAQNGDINTYTLIINNPLDNNNYLSSLVPSAGTLNPEFDKDILSYTIDLENEINTLSFEVTLESNKASVTGHEIKGVDEGTNIRNIVVTAEDGSTKTYVITINKELASDARLGSLEIEGYPFEFDPDTFTYNIAVSNSKKKLLETEITAIPKDPDATINMMGDLNLTDGIINIYTIEVIAKDGYTIQSYTLNITRDSAEYTIRSNIYEIVRFDNDTDEDYVIGIQPSTIISDFKNNFENDPQDLKVYLYTIETQDTDLTATALILKLEKDNYVYDTLRVIVRGDLTKDGKVNITDQVKMINYVGRTTTFDKYQMLAGDLTFDGKVNITDQVKIINYVGRTITDLNNKPIN